MPRQRGDVVAVVCCAIVCCAAAAGPAMRGVLCAAGTGQHRAFAPGARGMAGERPAKRFEARGAAAGQCAPTLRLRGAGDAGGVCACPDAPTAWRTACALDLARVCCARRRRGAVLTRTRC